MAKDTGHKANKPAPETGDGALGAKIRQAAEEAGITQKQADAVIKGATVKGGKVVGGLGDGVFMSRVFDFLKKVWPLLVPFFSDDDDKPESDPTPDGRGPQS